MVEVRSVDLLGRPGQQPHLDLHSGGAEAFDPFARHPGVGVERPHHHPAEPGRQDRLGAGRSPTMVITRLEGDDHGGGDGRRGVEGVEAGSLGMWGAGPAVVSLGEDLTAGVDEDRTHPGVGMGEGVGCQFQGPAHGELLGAGGGAHRLVGPAVDLVGGAGLLLGELLHLHRHRRRLPLGLDVAVGVGGHTQ